MRKQEVIDKINLLVTTFDEIDEYIRTQSEELQKIDWELSDWLHYIENNEFDKEVSHKIINKIRELRKIRRDLHQESSIEATYKNNYSKLTGNNTRPFLLAEINKTNNNLETEYKNRVITEEDIESIIEEPKHRGRPKKVVEDEI